MASKLNYFSGNKSIVLVSTVKKSTLFQLAKSLAVATSISIWIIRNLQGLRCTRYKYSETSLFPNQVSAFLSSKICLKQ
jgi:hypothetical protein